MQSTKHGGYEAFESADGKLLYYTKVRTRRELWSVPVEGGEETLVVSPVWTGFWAATEIGILFPDFSAPPNAPVPVNLWNPATHRVAQIGTLEKATPHAAPGFCVTRDGSRILYVREDRSDADIMLVENFR